MSVPEYIKKAPETANELLLKLADTSDGAVKTREKLLAQLKEEIEQLIGRKEEHLFPVLKKHNESKKLVAGATDEHKKIRELVGELEKTEVTDESFIKKVEELRRTFQAQIQSEKKELIPAVKKALEAEESEEIANRMQGAGQERRQNEDKKQERSPGRNGLEDSSERLQKAVRQTAGAANEVSKTIAASGEAAKETGERLAASATRSAATAAQDVMEASGAATTFTPQTMGDLSERTITTMTDVSSAWLDFMEAATGSAGRFVREMPSATTPMRWASISSRAGTEFVVAWLNVSSRMMGLSRRLSQELPKGAERDKR